MRVLRVLPLVAAALVVLGTLPITLSRLTGWTGAPGIVLTAFAPLAVGSYAVALGLVTIATVVGRRRSRVNLSVAVLVSGLLALHLVWVAPMVLGGAPEPADGAERVTVLAVNAQFGRADADVVVDAVRERGVELLVVSEITPRFVAAADGAGLRDLLPHRAGRPGATVNGTMVFSAAPIEVVDRVDTTFDSLVVRTLDLTVLATHPAPPQSPANWRRDQPKVLDAAREHAVDAVVGDLNATLDHPTVRELVDAGWRDAVELTNGGLAPTWPAHGEQGFPFAVVQIDHVLVRDSLAVTAVDTFEVPDSDHLAVVATVAAT